MVVVARGLGLCAVSGWLAPTVKSRKSSSTHVDSEVVGSIFSWRQQQQSFHGDLRGFLKLALTLELECCLREKIPRIQW